MAIEFIKNGEQLQWEAKSAYNQALVSSFGWFVSPGGTEQLHRRFWTIGGFRGSPKDGFEIKYASDDQKIEMELWGSASVVNIGAHTYTQDVWIHAIMEMDDGGTNRLWTDNVDRGTSTSTIRVPNSQKFTLAGAADFVESNTCIIAFMGMTGRTLTAGERGGLFRGVNPFALDCDVSLTQVIGDPDNEVDWVQLTTAFKNGTPTKVNDNPAVELLENYL